MEFTKVMSIYNRMCNHYYMKNKSCIGCPMSILNNHADMSCRAMLINCPKDAEVILLKWDKGHPQKTIMQDFIEKHPNARINSAGLPTICPTHIGYVHKCPSGSMTCNDCWNQSIDE